MLLSLSGCGEKTNEAARGAVAEEEITKEKLQEIIRSSPKPFVLVNFYATWCGPCRKEMPGLVNLEKDEAGDVQVVLISIDNEDDIQAKLPGFLEEYGISFKTWVRRTGPLDFVHSVYGPWNGNIPLSLIFDNKGNLVEPISGMTTETDIKMVIENYKMMRDA